MKKEDIKVLVACEESQAVTIAFRHLGIQAFSCDIQECSGGHPEWHYKEDVFNVIDREHWDMMIAFPPCTDLAVSGAAHFKRKIASGEQQRSVDFFLRIANSNVKRIAIENPIGIMSSRFRKPDQIINPNYFGDPVRKPTCLWLKNLPVLLWFMYDNLFTEKTHVEQDIITMTSKKTGRERTYSKWEYDCACSSHAERAKLRSKTFPGIAKQMAIQWTEYLLAST